MDPLLGQGIGGAGGLGGIAGAGKAAAGGAAPSTDSVTPFKDLLENSIQRVNEMQQAAEKAKIDLATGGTENTGEALAQIRKAELAFQQLIEIRNKLVDSYQELMRMQI